jgi:thioredoxin-related protein
MNLVFRRLILMGLMMVMPCWVLAQAVEEPLPTFFESSFNILPEDWQAASEQNKRLLIYFGQPGCPFCKELLEKHFRQTNIVTYTQKHFVSIGYSIVGAREIIWIDGKSYTEKSLAQALGVKYTPTLLLIGAKTPKGAPEILARINGLLPPDRFLHALAFVGDGHYEKTHYEQWMKTSSVH